MEDTEQAIKNMLRSGLDSNTFLCCEQAHFAGAFGVR
jgi:hypothetical protein